MDTFSRFDMAKERARKLASKIRPMWVLHIGSWRDEPLYEVVSAIAGQVLIRAREAQFSDVVYMTDGSDK